MRNIVKRLHIPNSEFTAWLADNAEHVPFCDISSSWKWVGDVYHSMIDIIIYDAPGILPDRDKERLDGFIAQHEIDRSIGLWRGETFHKIGKELEAAESKRGELSGNAGLLLNMEIGCWIYSTWKNKKNIEKIARIISEKFNLVTHIVSQPENRHYHIYIHKNPEVLKAAFPDYGSEPVKPLKAKLKGPLKPSEDLIKQEAELIKQLQALRKKMGK